MNYELIALLRCFCRAKTLGWLTALAACVPLLQQWARRLQARTLSPPLPLVSAQTGIRGFMRMHAPCLGP